MEWNKATIRRTLYTYAVHHNIMNICSSLIRRSIIKMRNMTFPLSYIFFYLCHGEKGHFVSFDIQTCVPTVHMLTRLKVSVCALSTVLHHVRTRATGAYKRKDIRFHQESVRRHGNKQEWHWVSGTAWVLMLLLKWGFGFIPPQCSSARSMSDDLTQTQF